MRRQVLIAVAIVAAMTAGTASGASPARVTKRKAEVDVLRATRVIANWNVGLIDPRTHLLLPNTSAVCRATLSTRVARHHVFRCSLHHNRTRVELRYIAKPRLAFRLKVIRVYRTRR